MSRSRHGSLVICILVLVAGLAVSGCASAGEVRWEDEKLYVDGEPFFFYGFLWGRDELPPDEFPKYHFNIMCARTPEEARAATEAGIYCMADMQGDVSRNDLATRPEEETAKLVQEFLKEPSVIIWFAGDDLGLPEHVLRTRDVIRRYDQDRPIHADITPGCRDPRIKDFSKVVDMFGPYYYPLPLRSYEIHAESFWDIKLELTGRKYIHGVLQCSNVGGRSGGLEGYECVSFMTPGQLRLNVFYAISHGLRGIVYWPISGLSPRPIQDMPANLDTLNEAAIIGCELEYLGPMIVAGDEAHKGAYTSQEEVGAYQINGEGYTLIILTKLGEDYHRAVDDAVVEDLAVYIPQLELNRAWAVSPPGVQELKVELSAYQRKVTVPRMEIAQVILLSDDASLASEIHNKMQQRLPDMARFAVGMLEGYLPKLQRLEGQLWRLGIRPQVCAQGIASAQKALAAARKHLEANRYSIAYTVARRGQRGLRIALRTYFELAREYVRTRDSRVAFFALYQYSLAKAFAGFDDPNLAKVPPPPLPDIPDYEVDKKHRVLELEDGVPMARPGGRNSRELGKIRPNIGQWTMLEAHANTAKPSNFWGHITVNPRFDPEAAMLDALSAGDINVVPYALMGHRYCVWLAQTDAPMYVRINTPAGAYAMEYEAAKSLRSGEEVRGSLVEQNWVDLYEMAMSAGKGYEFHLNVEDDLAADIVVFKSAGPQAARQVAVTWIPTKRPGRSSLRYEPFESGLYGVGIRRSSSTGGGYHLVGQETEPQPGRDVVLMDDRNWGNSSWGVIMGAQDVLRKIVIVDEPLDQVISAKVQWRMSRDPSAMQEDNPDMLAIAVNGQEVARDTMWELGSKGWHELEIDPALLTQGENRLDFSKQGHESGIAWMYLNMDRATGRSMSSVDGGKTFTADWVRPTQRVVDWTYLVGPGEYFIRLKLRVR